MEVHSGQGLGFLVDALLTPLLDANWVQRSHTVELFGTWGHASNL
jgi:hypothetical protein